ncbi:MAG TPA: chitobiase/beta-hexosaminidase C-terminal domain-containing protein, partial [Verrucomicrobiae bacterium]|nr:chitobiase/beta-hexosaminidase C-terminal domain-containing protein [Verrucomicrobiae bacterium]
AFSRHIARLNPDGSEDPTFVGHTNNRTECILMQPDGKILISGFFTLVNDSPRSSVARLNADGTLDPTFRADADAWVWTIASDFKKRLMFAGFFHSVAGAERNTLARLNSESTPVADPAPVLAVGTATANSLVLNWSDSSTSRNGYTIEQKNGTGFSQVANVNSATRNYTVSGLTSGSTWVFRLVFHNADGSAGYSNEAAGSTAAAVANSAAFLGADAGTRGSWKGVYGTEGFSVVGDVMGYPSYVRVNTIGKSDWVWQYSTQNASALQKASGADRLAACWYSPASFSIDFVFAGGQSHRVAAYFLDWDLAGRNETIQVTDGDTGRLLDTRNINAFGSGLYFAWNLSGHVKITVSANTGNAVLSGLFFGGSGSASQQAAAPTISPLGGAFSSPQQLTLASATAGAEIRYTLDGSPPSVTSALYNAPITISSSATVSARAFASGMNPSAIASASFTISANTSGPAKLKFRGIDSDLHGTWKGFMGGDGYSIPGDMEKLPSYATLSAAGKADWVWQDGTEDTRALQKAAASGRKASCSYSSSVIQYDLDLRDGKTHSLGIYCLDWDRASRAQIIEVLDFGTGTVLHTLNLNTFSSGLHVCYDLKGHVIVRVTNNGGLNAVVSGLLFDATLTVL